MIYDRVMILMSLWQGDGSAVTVLKNICYKVGQVNCFPVSRDGWLQWVRTLITTILL